jgi:exosortase
LHGSPRPQGQVQVVQQYAMVAMIPTVVIVIAGRRVARALAFPLGFLLLGVPVGEALIPPMMDWTADFTVTALRLSGIPVYREGTFFTIPSGQWSVVEGCSGPALSDRVHHRGRPVRVLSYQKTWKRILFVVLSVIVPIIANGMRAYMIVMIAHLSDMKLALGIDHLIYGWLFFGLVMLLLFWIGSFWRDPEPGNSAQSATLSPGRGGRHAERSPARRSRRRARRRVAPLRGASRSIRRKRRGAEPPHARAQPRDGRSNPRPRRIGGPSTTELRRASSRPIARAIAWPCCISASTRSSAGAPSS